MRCMGSAMLQGFLARESRRATTDTLGAPKTIEHLLECRDDGPKVFPPEIGLLIVVNGFVHRPLLDATCGIRFGEQRLSRCRRVFCT